MILGTIFMDLPAGTEIAIEAVGPKALLRVGQIGSENCRLNITLSPDGLLRLYGAIGDHLAEHDAPAAPPIPAEAATDDAESLPPGWRATDCGYEHICGDWVDATHMDAYARAYAAGHRLVGRFATPLQAMQALDARRRDLDDDTAEFDTAQILSSPGIASSYGQGFGVEITEDEIRAGRINAPRQVP